MSANGNGKNGTIWKAMVWIMMAIINLLIASLVGLLLHNVSENRRIFEETFAKIQSQDARREEKLDAFMLDMSTRVYKLEAVQAEMIKLHPRQQSVGDK